MDVSVTAALPSIIMQKFLFNCIEHIEGTRLVDQKNLFETGAHVAVRIVAAVHTVFQCCYALLALLPVTGYHLISTLNGTHGNSSKKITDIMREAFVSLAYPVVASGAIVINPHKLDLAQESYERGLAQRTTGGISELNESWDEAIKLGHPLAREARLRRDGRLA